MIREVVIVTDLILLQKPRFYNGISFHSDEQNSNFHFDKQEYDLYFGVSDDDPVIIFRRFSVSSTENKYFSKPFKLIIPEYIFKIELQ